MEPVSSSPSEIRKIALSLGRLLRTTRKVTRGLGSIRQDVNVSVNNSGVVEVKGVQQLDQLEKVVEYEAKRQHGLLKIAQKIKQKQLVKISRQNDVYDIINLLKSCKSKIIQKAINDGASIHAIKIKNFAGMLSYSPYEGIRLGKELGQLVRFFGIGGIFHLDELPNYGIEKLDIEKIKEQLSISQNDSFIIIAGKGSKIDFAIDSIINRIEDAKNGVPAETRLATQSGETVFLRPRPGASRMYPETDIFPVKVTKEEIEFAKKNIPKSWHESLADLQKNYQLNPQLAEQIFDSNYLDLFEKICSDKLNSPNFVASILCSTITNLERQGLDSTLLKTEEILKSFDLLIKEKITKESMEIIFEKIMAGEASSVEEAIQKGKVGMIDDKELEKICETIIKENQSIIDGQGLHSIGALMGLTMKMVRGKASGEKVNQLLKEKIQNYLDNKK